MAKNVNVNIPIITEGERADKTPSPAVQKPNLEKRSTNEIDLNILLKFIKPYDGSRDTINSFLTNCNNAYELATESQKFILFKYILSQLQGKAEIATSIKDFTTYEQLKEFLKIQFSQRKHYSHLITDLQESKQSPSDTVVQFSTKVESILTQLLTEISMNPTKKSEIPGRTAAMEDLALHHFLMGLHPRISNIVRCRSPKNLNEAIGLAISEEKIQQTLYRKTENATKSNKTPLQGQSMQPKQPYRPFKPQYQSSQFRPPQGQFTPRPQGQFTPRPGQQNYRPPYRPPQGQPNVNSFPAKPQGYPGQTRYNHHQQQQFNKQRVNFVEEEGYDETDYYPGPSVPEEPNYDNCEEYNDYAENNDNNEEYYPEDNLNE